MPVLEKLKSAYLIWHSYHTTLPQVNRYTLGNKVDQLFIETIENIFSAIFLSNEERLPYVRMAMRKFDTLKIMLMVLWETGSVNNKRYVTLSEALDVVGKMLGGWHGQLSKASSAKALVGL